MCTDSRQELRTGRQALFYRNVLCIAIHSWSLQLSENGFYSPEKQVVPAGREGILGGVCKNMRNLELI